VNVTGKVKVEFVTQSDSASPIPFLLRGTVDWEHDPLAEVLLDGGKLKRSELYQMQEVSQTRAEALGVALVKFGILSETDLAEALDDLTGLGIAAAQDYATVETVPDSLPLRFLKSAFAVPLSWDDETLVLAMAEPRDLDTIHSISVTVGRRIEPRIGLYSHIQNCLDSLVARETGPQTETSDSDEDDYGSDDLIDDVSHLRELASEAPTIQTVNRLLQEAISIGASDIHFEPNSEGLRVRYRVDGALRLGETLPLGSSAAINSRVKIMARLDIAEHRLPQDGRIQIKIAGRDINIRVSTVPTLYGEGIVIRILDKSRVNYDYEFLGLDADTLARFQHILANPTGIFLVTGPTGSGKSTTLYTGLSQINSIEKKIITVEDPIEYQLEGVNQIAVHNKIDLTFANVLKTILRQDPDIIMVGEMRDTETARIAVQAALTGHLVLSTLHTNDAISGITRLLDMGVEDYLVTSTVNAVFAQRLVRRLCKHCKTEHPDSKGEMVAVGCDRCGHTGYRGRTMIYELFEIDDSIRKLILTRAGTDQLREQARALGMTTMHDCGMRLVAEGLVSRAEVLRVTSGD
jgi:general secretion pathway protein E